jgi:membrane-associated protein
MLPVLAISLLGLSISNKAGYLLPALVGVESMGIPSPGETGLVVAAILASDGKLEIWLVVLIGVASAIVGDNLGYAIGRVGGRRLISRSGPFHARRLALLAYGDRFFERHGAKSVFFGRWITILRVTAAWMAGINGMPFRRFFIYNALGGITWAVTVSLAAYYLGHRVVHLIGRAGLVAGIAVAVGASITLVALRLRERRALRREAPAADEPTTPAAES